MTPHALFNDSLHVFHRDFPRRTAREFARGENEERRLGDLCKPNMAAARRLRIYNGSGVLHIYGGLDYFMELIQTKDHCYTLLI